MPGLRFHGFGKSILTAERYAEARASKDRQADEAARVEGAREELSISVEDEVPSPTIRKKSRQEESRLGTYVSGALENIYESDSGPSDRPYVFDVHSERPGSEYENVDVLAVHWRSDSCVEIVAVEIKLALSAKLLQQARNYTRFADRVWIAVPFSGEVGSAGTILRDLDPLLFDHIVECGLGILACRRGRGSSYEILPVHWPRRLVVDPVEKEMFVERYRGQLEEAQVIRPRETRYPRL